MCKWSIYMVTRDGTALRCKSKEWLVCNQDNVSEWSDMSTL